MSKVIDMHRFKTMYGNQTSGIIACSPKDSNLFNNNGKYIDYDGQDFGKIYYTKTSSYVKYHIMSVEDKKLSKWIDFVHSKKIEDAIKKDAEEIASLRRKVEMLEKEIKSIETGKKGEVVKINNFREKILQIFRKEVNK